VLLSPRHSVVAFTSDLSVIASPPSQSVGLQSSRRVAWLSVCRFILASARQSSQQPACHLASQSSLSSSSSHLWSAAADCDSICSLTVR